MTDRSMVGAAKPRALPRYCVAGRRDSARSSVEFDIAITFTPRRTAPTPRRYLGDLPHKQCPGHRVFQGMPAPTAQASHPVEFDNPGPDTRNGISIHGPEHTSRRIPSMAVCPSAAASGSIFHPPSPASTAILRSCLPAFRLHLTPL
jgi:hypothetical protein